MMRSTYLDQVRLLVLVLPYIGKERVFAIKGGTAINLFYRHLPRLSVDIDLVYLPIKSRADSLKEIDDALDRVASSVEKGVNGIRTKRIEGGGGGDTRVLVSRGNARIKIEISPVVRGSVMSPVDMRIQPAVEREFGFAEAQVVSFEDLYAGKLVAALDRQHPRDIFDVKMLFENEGISDRLFRVFLVYLISSGRPMHELINPAKKDISTPYEQEFDGMSTNQIGLEELQGVQQRMFDEVRSRIDSEAAHFLRSVHIVKPDFSLIGLPQAEQLPAVQWKMVNLQRLMAENPSKHRDQLNLLEEVLEIHSKNNN